MIIVNYVVKVLSRCVCPESDEFTNLEDIPIPKHDLNLRPLLIFVFTPYEVFPVFFIFENSNQSCSEYSVLI